MEYMKRIGMFIMLLTILVAVKSLPISERQWLFLLVIFSIGAGLYVGSTKEDKEKTDEQ